MPRAKSSERFRPIRPAVHNDPIYRDLSGQATLLWHTLYTHPSVLPIGCIRTTIEGLGAEVETKMKPLLGTLETSGKRYPQRFALVVDELVEAGEIEVSPTAPLVALTKWFWHNEPQNPNQVKALFSAPRSSADL